MRLSPPVVAGIVIMKPTLPFPAAPEVVVELRGIPQVRFTDLGSEPGQFNVIAESIPRQRVILMPESLSEEFKLDCIAS